MSFFEGFINEIEKTAKPNIKRILAAITRTPEEAKRTRKGLGLGRALIVGGGAGTLGAAVGIRRGRKKGYSEGTNDVTSVARRARIIGRREGILAYHRALMAQRARAARR